MSNNAHSKGSNEECILREGFFKIFENNSIPNEEILEHLSLFMNRQNLSRILYFNELYKKIINVPGVIMEFGVYYGRDLPLLQNLRGIYEPYNYSRKIIGFDTFEGLTEIHEKDGKQVSKGTFSVPGNYENYLRQVLMYHEKESPISHIKKFEIIKGDINETLPKYLKEHPETIIAFVYLDLDIYEPTKKTLELIKPYFIKGSVIAFDEMNDIRLPGETIAFDEVFGLNNYRLYRIPYEPLGCYLIYGE